jgi:hypothetical protein
VDVLGIDDVVAARVKVDRRIGRGGREDSLSLLSPLRLPGGLPVSIPIGAWGEGQLDVMTTMHKGEPDPILEHVQAIAQQLRVSMMLRADVKPRTWFRLAPIPASLHPARGLRMLVQVTNLDPSLRLTFRIGERSIPLRNTLVAYPGHVPPQRDPLALEKSATTLAVLVAPGVLAPRDRAVMLNIDAYCAENIEGEFEYPPLSWFHFIGVSQ